VFQLRRKHRLRLAAASAAALCIPIVLATAPTVSAAPVSATGVSAGTVSAGTGAKAAPSKHPKHGHREHQGLSTPSLPAPPKPPRSKPGPRAGAAAPDAIVSTAARQAIGAARAAAARAAAHPLTRAQAAASRRAAAALAPSQAVTWGNGPGRASALVLYDSTGTWGWLGELYAIAAGNLATHFGSVTAEPVADYVSGQVNNYTATIYLGSTYNEPIPATFLSDALSTSKPIIWAGDNIWQLTGTEGSAADTAFKAAYGWDPSNSYFDTTDNPLTVSYKGQTFSRNSAAGAEVLAPDITNPSLVTVLGSANCTNSSGTAVNCAPIAQTTGTSYPWAMRSGNITYVGEIPFSYMSETDRYVAFSDLLFPALAPAATASRVALVRLEDVAATNDPTALDNIANYLSSQGVPFSINVIPEYTDPNGYYNSGTPVTETLAQAPALVTALKYAEAHGGSLNQEGDTHQYSNVANPYDGVSGDDAEFYRAQCATTQNPPYTFHSPCQNTDWVTWEGPVSGDSQSWALSRVTAGQALFTAAGLTPPAVWVTPHYFASVADYNAIDSAIKLRYDREIFVSGQLSGQPLNYSRIFGQFFPYQVYDLYGEQIVPENLGDYEPTEVNNNPPRTAANLAANAQVNLAVTQSTASFFFDPSEPLSQLETIVSSIKALGYTFVGPTGLPS
jgi:uncharacterized protein YdaL